MSRPSWCLERYAKAPALAVEFKFVMMLGFSLWFFLTLIPPVWAAYLSFCAIIKWLSM